MDNDTENLSCPSLPLFFKNFTTIEKSLLFLSYASKSFDVLCVCQNLTIMHSLRELERERVAERVKHKVGKVREKQGGWNQKTFNCFRTKNDLKEKEKLEVNDNLVEWKEVVYRKNRQSPTVSFYITNFPEVFLEDT